MRPGLFLSYCGRRRQKTDLAVSLAAERFAVKRVAEALGVSRSNLVERRDGKSRPRGPYRRADDKALLPLIRRFVDKRPMAAAASPHW